MVEMVEQVIDSILSIENEQSKVLAYVSELEMRRKQLQNQLGSIEDVLTNGAKMKLYNKIMQMEMKISFVKPTEKIIIHGSKQRKCKHNNVTVRWRLSVRISIKTKFVINTLQMKNVQIGDCVQTVIQKNASSGWETPEGV